MFLNNYSYSIMKKKFLWKSIFKGEVYFYFLVVCDQKMFDHTRCTKIKDIYKIKYIKKINFILSTYSKKYKLHK